MQKVATFLMFGGKAEEAMRFYVSLFPDAKIESIVHYGDDDEGEASTVKHAVFTFGDQRLVCTDSIVEHGFSFTPAMSLHVTCDTSEEIDRLFAGLSEGGHVLMPLARYPFSARFAWLNDRFGVSWQLTLAPASRAT